MTIYSSPRAFEQALNHQLTTRAKAGAVSARRMLCLERYLARVATVAPHAILKGGMALKLRLPTARTTKDIDLDLNVDPVSAVELLQQAGRLDLGDFLEYRVRRKEDLFIAGMATPGLRLHAEGFLGGRRFGDPFHLDVTVFEPVAAPPEVLTTTDFLAFAEIAPAHVRALAIEAHIAQKLHAYTRVRATPNTRVRDLPDLALLAQLRFFEASTLFDVLSLTFRQRATHQLPAAFPPPPQSWSRQYTQLVVEHGLHWQSLAEVHAVAAAFLDPVLGGECARTWDPTAWAWRVK